MRYKTLPCAPRQNMSTFLTFQHNKEHHQIWQLCYASPCLYITNRYVINDVNSRSDVLPNITLGLIALDDCRRDISGLAQTLRFLPLVDQLGYQHWASRLYTNETYKQGTCVGKISYCMYALNCLM